MLAGEREFGQQFGKFRRGFVAGIARLRALRGEVFQRRGRLQLCERRALRFLPGLLLQQPALLIFQLLDASALDLRLTLSLGDRLGMRVGG
jgi:hypothetical protein